MRFAPGALVLFLAATSAAAQEPAPPAASSPSPGPTPAASPAPTPRYRLIPYGFERVQAPSPVPLLRFQDEAEVRSLEMNAAIARFFDKREDRGNMLRGATPGGAPTRREMAEYRPGVTPGVSLLGLALVVGKEVRKQIERRKGMPPAEPSPSPTPSPAASPTARR
ncbi:MAG: hypothetical protein KA385_18225 [Vicinamibacteria bacterium]|jgi:hypothetical protein|nr:hypothetical protein [Vicinamibacteria bacterium]